MALSFSTLITIFFFSLLFISIMPCQVDSDQGTQPSPQPQLQSQPQPQPQPQPEPQPQPQPQQTTLMFYLHDLATGPNATVAPVAGICGKVWSYNTFGTIFVVDDLVTENSIQVGRAQGLITASALDGSNVNVLLSIVFDNLQYSGSSLEIQGASRQRENYRELSVVSGTGKFRYARGYAAFETAYFDATTNHSIIRLTLTFLQP